VDRVAQEAPVILVLDDSPSRHRAFKQGLIGAHVAHVTRADEAVLQLSAAEPWSVICLDHDLQDHGDDTAGNGMQVAQWIAGRTRAFKSALIVVHSVNPVSGPRMVALLRGQGLKAVRAPGIWQDAEALARFVQLDRMS
jgi:CheY-like chemotaxis protein